MKKVLKNLSKLNIKLEIYNNFYEIGAKKSLTIDHEGKDKHPATILLEKYGFLKDITPKVVYKSEIEPELATPVAVPTRVRKSNRVVYQRKTRGKKKL